MSFRQFLLIIMLLCTVACATHRDTKTAQEAVASGNWDEAFELYDALLQKNPKDMTYKIARERVRSNAALDHLRKASSYFERDMYPEATFELKQVLYFDPSNQAAQTLNAMIKEAQETLEAEADRKEQTQKDGMPNLPKLTPNTWAPLNLIFTNQSARDIYISMGKAYGINVVVDSELRDKKVTIDLRNLNFLKSLDTLMVLNRHFFKIVDDNTIIILEDNKNNRDRYDNQIIQTFYLSNITPKDLKAHLRQLGGIKEFAENEKLNAITIKGTVDEVALVQKIITDNDKAQPEVVVELELLEVNKNAMRRVGIMPIDPSQNALYRAGIYADPQSRSDDDRDLNGLRGFFPRLEKSDILTIVPAVAIDFLKQKGGSKQVANPQLRVTSGETGLVTIGQSIPIAQTRFTNPQISGATSGNNSIGDNALTTFNYSDVGIKIQVTPRVHYNNEITLEMELEVSSVISGGDQPTLGKRQVKTIIRLRNGETNVLAGLLSNDERKSLQGIPGLSSIPLLGRLFSNDEKVVTQTDIILTTRPVIIRSPNITKADRAPYEVSTLRLSNLYSQSEQEAKAHGEGKTLDLSKSGSPNGEPKRTAAEPVEPTEPLDPEDEPSYEEQAPIDEAAPLEEDQAPPDEKAPPSAARPVEPGQGQGQAPAEAAATEAEPTEPELPVPAMLAFTPTALDVRQDENLDYQLFITNVEGMQRGEIVVEFNPSVLQATVVELGDFFGAVGNQPLMTPAWDNANGRLTMIISQRIGGEPFSGTGVLANLRFVAKAPGNGNLQISVIKLTDANQKEIQAEGLTARYEVAP